MLPRCPHVSSSIVLMSLLFGCAGSMEGSEAETTLDAGRPGGSGDYSAVDEPSTDSSAGDAGQVDSGPALEVGRIESERPGPYAVGTRRIALTVSLGRTLTVQLWYPADESARAETRAGRPLAEIEPTGRRRAALTALIAAAPDGCTNKTMHAADAPPVLPQEKPFPGVVFSHCTDCTRFSSFSSAEHLASWGFVVAAPDHEGGTLYDAQEGLSAGVTGTFLETRAKDMTAVIDTLLDAKTELLSADLRGRIDPAALGVFGHGFGAMTAALVLQNDARVSAGVMIASPPDDPAIGKVSVAQIAQPSMLLLAREDNHISEVGNISMRTAYESLPNEAWLVEVTNAGHWSFSDICGLTEEFNAGCGMGTRQTGAGLPFTYLDNELARAIGKAYTLAYFGRELAQDGVAAEYLKSARPADYVYVKHHK